MACDQRYIRFYFRTQTDDIPLDSGKQPKRRSGGVDRDRESVARGCDERDDGMERMMRLISRAQSEMEAIMNILSRVPSEYQQIDECSAGSKDLGPQRVDD